MLSWCPGDHGATGEKGLRGDYGEPGIPGKDGEPGTPGQPGMSEASNRETVHQVFETSLTNGTLNFSAVCRTKR